MSAPVSSFDQPKAKYMTIPELCANLLKHGEIMRIRCKQLSGDLSAIFALTENDLEKEPYLQQIYHERLEQFAADREELKEDLRQSDEIGERLTSKAATKPIPFVRLS